jgi:hypothetical protein
MVHASLVYALLLLNMSSVRPGMCLGPFCFAPDLMTAQQIRKEYGQGAINNGGGTLCYVDRGLYVSFTLDDHDEANPTISGVYVGATPAVFCRRSRASTKHFSTLETREGLSVGDSLAKLRRLYGGRPNFQVTPYMRGRASASWLACDDCALLSINVDLRHDRVVAIDIDDSE